jgi:hypothetical protein
MGNQEVDLDALKSRLRAMRAKMSRALWSEWLVDITAALLVDESGYIVDATKPADLLFGYIPGELAGKPLKILIPTRYYAVHDQHWERYWLAPIAQAMGSRVTESEGHGSRPLDIVGAMKNGREKNLTIGLTPLAVNESRCAIALVSERF